MLIKTKEELESMSLVGEYILVKLNKKEGKSQGGIFLPDSVVDRIPMEEGLVISIGPGWFNAQSSAYVPVVCNPGDNIIFSPYGELNFKTPEEELYKIIPDKCVRAIL
jgi:co-chaperonin GroES (HSP10)